MVHLINDAGTLNELGEGIPVLPVIGRDLPIPHQLWCSAYGVQNAELEYLDGGRQLMHYRFDSWGLDDEGNLAMKFDEPDNSELLVVDADKIKEIGDILYVIPDGWHDEDPRYD